VSHTEGRYMQDLGFPDGEIFAGVGDIVWSAVANANVVRNAVADWSINQAASLTVIYAVNLTGLMIRRSGFFEDIQEQFGSQSGTGIAGSAQTQLYRPDVIPAMNTGQQLQPRTAFKTKGFKLVEFDVIYSVGTLALTSISVRVDQAVFAPNTAIAKTAVLAPGANGLSTAVPSTGPYDTTIVMPAAQQIYRIASDSQLWIELTVVTPSTSTFQLYGFDCDIEFNYN
jgi:hypothetical protein